ncbi:Hypothetical Protein FCC1311_080242 [Hondaea fermentalgiana]|uniref:Uncharacterized protein n=1 Tax=Hondaea fermentalgiana TaxID=2315210 RepID=A0A2R5GNC0_9STRA|nr:Hypothetical Protein FCC1311_080242 [Hondaea fermentalgiana]|eukprot:GBG31799.1 Hypothetical Protein FCC1311_080242 [Hondaea fermentalgiana]
MSSHELGAEVLQELCEFIGPEVDPEHCDVAHAIELADDDVEMNEFLQVTLAQAHDLQPTSGEDQSIASSAQEMTNTDTNLSIEVVLLKDSVTPEQGAAQDSSDHSHVQEQNQTRVETSIGPAKAKQSLAKKHTSSESSDSVPSQLTPQTI